MALGDKATGKNNGAAAGRVQTGNASGDTREKAVAFLNIDFPTKNGEKKRLTSLALMESDPFHAQIIEYLADPATREENTAKVIAKLLGSCNFTKTGDAALLDL